MKNGRTMEYMWKLSIISIS